MGLKEAIIQQSKPDGQHSRNSQSLQRKTASSSMGPVPKLDFKRLKKVQEFKDWYAYASKLEDSVKYLRQRIRQIEEDNQVLNQKFRKEQTAKDSLFVLNEKLNKALKRANIKITEVKEKYKNKISQKCYYCNNDLELSVNLGTTFD